MQQKTFNQIVQNMINNIHDTLPDVDSKSGTWLRDVIIDPVSDEFGALYAQMKLMEMQQSILTAVDKDLDKLAANFFITRKTATKSYGKLRFYIDNRDSTLLPDEILIPKGTVVSTIPTITKQAIQVQTTDNFYGNKEKIKILPIDVNYPYYVYIELPAESINKGSENNVGTGELVQQANNINPNIAFVRNPFAYTNGSDYEDDASLILRINLAISGANIGTKNGYLSYILKQDGVYDAKVVGAGEFMMRRDGGYIGYGGVYVTGSGGMVDIYIRGEQRSEKTYVFPITDQYISPNNPDQYGDILLPIQPVTNIVDISMVDSVNSTNIIHLINAADYELEIRTVFNESLDKSTVKKYYRDIQWDFSITDDFQQEVYDYYILSTESLPSKSEIDNELNTWSNLMTNINYGLDWGYMSPSNEEEAKNFTPYYYTDGRIYMLKSEVLNGLICVKRNDKIYMRIYASPDYELLKDDTLKKGNSIYAKDRISWLQKDIWKSLSNTSKLQSNYNLVITYNINELVNNLQDGIEQKRVLTADVLIKQAEELPIEVILNTRCFVTEDPEIIKNSIINNVVTYIDTLKKLGGEFDVSDIISVVKQISGVDAVELDGNLKPEIRVVSKSSKFKITANDNQYFKVKNIVVNVQKNDIIQ